MHPHVPASVRDDVAASQRTYDWFAPLGDGPEPAGHASEPDQQRGERGRSNDVPRCLCGHTEEAHEHHRQGRDCGVCGAAVCSRFRRT
jgi:hypothetical protein